jgi:hypothetical protein
MDADTHIETAQGPAHEATNEAAGEMHVSALVGGAAVGVLLAALWAGSVILIVVLALGAAIGAVCALGIASLRQGLWRRTRRSRPDRETSRRPRRPQLVAGVGRVRHTS